MLEYAKEQAILWKYKQPCSRWDCLYQHLWNSILSYIVSKADGQCFAKSAICGDGIASRMQWKLDVYLEFHIFVREQRKNYVKSKLQEKRGNWLHGETSTKGQAESVYNNTGKRLSALTISNQRPAGGEKLERKKEIWEYSYTLLLMR